MTNRRPKWAAQSQAVADHDDVVGFMLGRASPL